MPVYIGTAGYVYPHWRKGAFYPSGLQQASELSHYLSNYPTVEINATFHAFPRLSTLTKWRQQSPPNALFSLKAPAIITHTKRLSNVTDDIINFCNIAIQGLQSNLGPILFQCPPSLNLSLTLLQSFLNDINYTRQTLNISFRIAIEFRSKDWFCQPVFDLLAKYDIALVNNIVVSDINFSKLDDSNFPNARNILTNHKPNWVYNRFHGSKNPQILTNFPDEILLQFASQYVQRVKQEKDFMEYSYFLNDWDAIAPKNARRYTEIFANLAQVKVRNLVDGFVPDWSKQKPSIKSFFANTTKNNQKKNIPTSASKSNVNSVIADQSKNEGTKMNKPKDSVFIKKMPSPQKINMKSLSPAKSPKKASSSLGASAAIKKKKPTPKVRDIASYFNSSKDTSKP